MITIQVSLVYQSTFPTIGNSRAITRTLCKLFVYQGFPHFQSLAIETRWGLLFRTTILLHSPDAISESSAIMQVSTTQTQQGISYAASTTKSLRKCLPSHMIQMVRFETGTMHYNYTFQRFKKSEESRLNTNVLPSFWSDLLYQVSSSSPFFVFTSWSGVDKTKTFSQWNLRYIWS